MSLSHDTTITAHKKKFFILIGLGVFIIALLFFFLLKESEKNEPTDEYLAVSLIDENDQYSQDSDDDGAYDWEEALWEGLDPNNPDSDGDGVLDGDYIKQKKQRAYERLVPKEVDRVHLSKSEQLGRSLYTALLAVQTSGEQLDEQGQEQIAENVENYISTLNLAPQLYLRDELNLVADTQVSVKKYRTEMERLFEQYPINAKEFQIAIEESAQSNLTKEDEIEHIQKRYEEYLQKLSVLEVPSLIAGRHIEFMNGLNQLNAVLKNFITERDELISLSFLIQVEDIALQILDASSYIQRYFEITKNPDVFN